MKDFAKRITLTFFNNRNEINIALRACKRRIRADGSVKHVQTGNSIVFNENASGIRRVAGTDDVVLIEPGGFDTDWAKSSMRFATGIPAYADLRTAILGMPDYPSAAPADVPTTATAPGGTPGEPETVDVPGEPTAPGAGSN